MRRLLQLGIAVALLTGCGSGNDTAQPQTSNTPPRANAGADITQSGDEVVELDGSGSFDADGDPLKYHWSFEYLPETSGVDERLAPFTVNHSAEAVTTTFAPDMAGTYVVELVVNDDRANSAPDYVVVTITGQDEIPVANAGEDATVKLGLEVNLNGSRSYDPAGHPLTYQWGLVDVPAASHLTLDSLVGATTATPTFQPDVMGVYVANLVVSNGFAVSAPDAVVVTVVGSNGPPVANGGEDFTAEDCTAIVLDASASVDPDGDALSYFWELQQKPAESGSSNADFSDRTAQTTTFWVDVAGIYVFSVAVTDGTYWSSPDIVTGTIIERKYNSDPVVEAGIDGSFEGGSAECEELSYVWECDECAAVSTTIGNEAFIHDPDDDPYTFVWSVIDGSATIDDPYSLITTVVLSGATPAEPGACEPNDFTFQLEATDCPGSVIADTVTMTVVCCGTKDK
ncbi:MAG: hypothetical protein JXB39_01525 [Deltaproteobacteria bacterium]|nr:hypothetical protein [Deltaproteobacteria bacterium]